MFGDSCPSIDTVQGAAYDSVGRFCKVPATDMASHEYSMQSNDRLLNFPRMPIPWATARQGYSLENHSLVVGYIRVSGIGGCTEGVIES